MLFFARPFFIRERITHFSTLRAEDKAREKDIMPSIFQRNWVIAVTTTTRPIMSFLVLFWPKLCFYCFMVNCAIFSTNSFFSSLPLPKVLCLMAATVATSLTQFYDIEGKKARIATAKLSLLLYVV